MRTITSVPLIARRSSQPRPQRSMVPGRKFSASTSALAASRLISACPSGSRRLHVIDFLLRDSTSHQYESPSRAGVPSRRRSSPRPGCSTLMTSAPNSPSSVQQKGAATNVARSSTVRPSSAEGTRLRSNLAERRLQACARRARRRRVSPGSRVEPGDAVKAVDQGSAKVRSFSVRDGWRMRLSALASIWRIRSRVTRNSCPTSSRVQS